MDQMTDKHKELEKPDEEHLILCETCFSVDIDEGICTACDGRDISYWVRHKALSAPQERKSYQSRNPTAFPSAMDYAEHLERDNAELKEELELTQVAAISRGQSSIALTEENAALKARIAELESIVNTKQFALDRERARIAELEGKK